jgi:hypothetical protein
MIQVDLTFDSVRLGQNRTTADDNGSKDYQEYSGLTEPRRHAGERLGSLQSHLQLLATLGLSAPQLAQALSLNLHGPPVRYL